MPCICGDVYCNCIQNCVCLGISCECDLCDRMRISQITPSSLEDEDLTLLSDISLHEKTPNVKYISFFEDKEFMKPRYAKKSFPRSIGNHDENRLSFFKKMSSTASTAENTSFLRSRDVQCPVSESQDVIHIGTNTTLPAAPIANLASKSVPRENLMESTSEGAERFPVLSSLSSEKSSYFNLTPSSHNKARSLTTDVGKSHCELSSSYQAEDITRQPLVFMGGPKVNFVEFLNPSVNESSSSSTNYESDQLCTSVSESVNVGTLNPQLTGSATPTNYESNTSDLTFPGAFTPDTLQSPSQRLPLNRHKSFTVLENRNLSTQSPQNIILVTPPKNRNLVTQSPNLTLPPFKTTFQIPDTQSTSNFIQPLINKASETAAPSVGENKFPILNILLASSTSAVETYAIVNNLSINSITPEESTDTTSDAFHSMVHLMQSTSSSRFEPKIPTQVPVIESTTNIKNPKKSSVRKRTKTPRSSVSSRHKSDSVLPSVLNQKIVSTKASTKASNSNIDPKPLTNVTKNVDESSLRNRTKTPRSSVSSRNKSDPVLPSVLNQKIVSTKSSTKPSNLNIDPKPLTNITKNADESSLLHDSRHKVQSLPSLLLSKSHSLESVELSDSNKRNATKNPNTVLSSVRISQSQPNLLDNNLMPRCTESNSHKSPIKMSFAVLEKNSGCKMLEDFPVSQECSINRKDAFKGKLSKDEKPLETNELSNIVKSKKFSNARSYISNENKNNSPNIIDSETCWIESNKTKNRPPISVKSEALVLGEFNSFDFSKSNKPSDSSENKISDSSVCNSPNKIGRKQYNTDDSKPSDKTDRKLSTSFDIGLAMLIISEKSISVENTPSDSNETIKITPFDSDKTIKNAPSDFNEIIKNAPPEFDETIKNPPPYFDETIKNAPHYSDETIKHAPPDFDEIIKNASSDSDETIKNIPPNETIKSTLLNSDETIENVPSGSFKTFENMPCDSVKIVDNKLSDSIENVSPDTVVIIVQNVQSDSIKTVKNVQSISVESGQFYNVEDLQSDSSETLEKVQSVSFQTVEIVQSGSIEIGSGFSIEIIPTDSVKTVSTDFDKRETLNTTDIDTITVSDVSSTVDIFTENVSTDDLDKRETLNTTEIDIITVNVSTDSDKRETLDTTKIDTIDVSKYEPSFCDVEIPVKSKPFKRIVKTRSGKVKSKSQKRTRKRSSSLDEYKPSTNVGKKSTYGIKRSSNHQMKLRSRSQKLRKTEK